MIRTSLKLKSPTKQAPGSSSQEQEELQRLAELVRELNREGHNPATSGNYSLRSHEKPGAAWVSESGIDKSLFSAEHMLLLELQTEQLTGDFAGTDRKSSDETALHLAVYRATQANCVLHSHFLDSLLFAELFPGQDQITLTGLELLKGFKGIKTHEANLTLPCFENTQDISGLAKKVEPLLRNSPTYGLLLRGHGIYVWGGSVLEAKRHLEVFVYLFRYYVARGGLNL
jgi:methylthioribulose-1-phosphate dehydratase